MRGYWHPTYQRYNPASPPDWRWQRAIALVESRRSASRKRDDEPTCRAVDFLRQLRRGATERTSRRVTRRYPDIMFALKLREGDPLRRLELECRVLARQSAAIVSEQMRIPLHIVTAYKDLFFAVEERIDATSYICHQIIGVTGNSSASPESWMRWAAYHHGPAVIAPWLDFLEHRDEQHDLATEDGWRRDSIALFLAVQNLAVDAEAAAKIIKNSSIVFGFAERTQKFRSVTAVFLDEMNKQLDQLPFRDRVIEPVEQPRRDVGGCRGEYSPDTLDRRKVS